MKWTYAVIPLAITAVLWGVVFASVPPSAQNFPLNDDWAYSKSLFALTRGEGVHYYRQPSMPLLGQWALAYPVVVGAGESHAALRLTTVVLSLLAVVGFHDLLRRETRLSPATASLAATALALNPVYFLVSGTFMSDVPAFALSITALAAYSRAMRSGRAVWLLAGASLATVAAATRQNTVVVPLAAAVLLWDRPGLRWRPAWVAGVGLPFVVGVLVNSWFAARADTVPLAPEVPSLRHLFLLGFGGAHYLGLSSLPMLLLRPTVVSWRRFLTALFVMADGVAVCVVAGHSLFPPHAFHGGLFPYFENMITPYGTLEGARYVVGDRPRVLGPGAQIVLTAAGCVGAAALFDRAAGSWRAASRSNPLVLYTTLHALLLVISPTLYDRYLIVLMPGALVVGSDAPGRLRWPLALAALTLFAAFSVGLMHDWLSWNSARWEVGRRALARGIEASDVEGGLEWDSWYSPLPVAKEDGDRPLSYRGLTLPFNLFRFPQIRGRYALSFSEMPDTEVLDFQPYRLWLVRGPCRFLLVGQRR